MGEELSESRPNSNADGLSTSQLSAKVGLKSIRTEKHNGDDFGRYISDEETNCLCIRNCGRMLCDTSNKTEQVELYQYYTGNDSNYFKVYEN